MKVHRLISHLPSTVPLSCPIVIRSFLSHLHFYFLTIHTQPSTPTTSDAHTMSSHVPKNPCSGDGNKRAIVSRDTSTTFPFMRLPVELRIMIAEYAMYYDGGLNWHWTKQAGDKRVGSFGTWDESRRYIRAKRVVGISGVSRQLRHETVNMWLTMNELRFEGPGGKTVGQIIQCAIDDFAFFVSRMDAKILSSLSLGVHVSSVPGYMRWLLKLPDLLQGPGAPIIRVVERDFYSHLGARLTVEDFMANCRVIKSLKENGTSTAAQQKWRIFPKAAMDGGMEGLKKNLSAEQYQLALDWIQTGI
jgi:hypothetical protein